jgi:multiple sugar transport system ATP-binding protein
MVFQNYALYPQYTARTKILSYFLFRKKTPELNALAKAKYQRTSALMGVEISHLLDHKPPTLSGGEKQRVALGRCITRDADVFLVDEPFANLDQALREKYRVNLKALRRQFDITTVYVTHDHHEALILADLLAVMNRGTIEQAGTPQEIYDAPKNLFVAGFLNLHVGAPPISLLEPRWLPQGERLGNVRVGVRPEDVEILGGEREGALGGTVTAQLNLPLKNGSYISLRVGDGEVHAQTEGRERHAHRQLGRIGVRRRADRARRVARVRGRVPGRTLARGDRPLPAPGLDLELPAARGPARARRPGGLRRDGP